MARKGQLAAEVKAVVEAVYVGGGFKTKSNYARQYATEIATAASLGLLTNLRPDGRADDTWRITTIGLRLIQGVINVDEQNNGSESVLRIVSGDQPEQKLGELVDGLEKLTTTAVSLITSLIGVNTSVGRGLLNQTEAAVCKDALTRMLRATADFTEAYYGYGDEVDDVEEFVTTPFAGNGTSGNTIH